ncbi:ATP-binding protein [Cyanobacterium aponinum]|uniref:ATP-binding protein n=1 Tax=Cyanobacterium aponinum TaxID=379064 RepID=UPI000C12AE35|nr:ATP-binding protein [Cyanobacterium aponinum]PHV63733.1 cell division protein FtsK [Cyanobacterium aponinum IPPAS B-1201]
MNTPPVKLNIRREQGTGNGEQCFGREHLTVNKQGIKLGDNCYWNPETLPNQHIVTIGASGSGKTQTLKAIALNLYRHYPTVNIYIIDFHGDQQIEGERYIPLNMISEYGINPLIINPDPEGGGSNIQSLIVTNILKQTLNLGSVQEGKLLLILKELYLSAGIQQNDISTWSLTPPNFFHLEDKIKSLAEFGDKDAQKLQLKLEPTFQYGVFSRPQLPLLSDGGILRLDLSKLPTYIAAIAAESFANQLLVYHKLMGDVKNAELQNAECRKKDNSALCTQNSALFRTFLFIDEAKEMPKKDYSAMSRIMADGRKFGLGLVVASQSERHLSPDVIGNSSTKIVLPVDQTEVKKVSSKFRFAEDKIANLYPLSALIRMGKDAIASSIIPYYLLRERGNYAE